MTTEYKIRDRSTKLFSTGGCMPSWTAKGKSWKTLEQLRAHLKLYKRGQYAGETKQIPATWEIVEYQLVETKKGSAVDFEKPLKALRKRYP
jgi:hypothetical protein